MVGSAVFLCTFGQRWNKRVDSLAPLCIEQGRSRKGQVVRSEYDAPEREGDDRVGRVERKRGLGRLGGE